MAGATKAEAAATRREKRKKVRILIVLLDKVVVNGLCVMVSEEHKGTKLKGRKIARLLFATEELV